MNREGESIHLKRPAVPWPTGVTRSSTDRYLRQMKGWVLAFAMALNMTLACQNESPPPTPSPSPSPGAWLHGSESVDSRVAESSHGSAHCGYQDSIFLIIGWPLMAARPA